MKVPEGMALIVNLRRREADHPIARLCGGCGDDISGVGITHLAYYYQRCSCDCVDYEHLVERICHLRCMNAMAPDAAADSMLNTASHILRNYKKGAGLADRIDAFLASRLPRESNAHEHGSNDHQPPG